MELSLTPRLARIAACVPRGARLADVGTDHGYLPVRLLLDGAIERAIASDLRPGPLERARETARRYGLEEKISFRLCDGLAAIDEGEADTIAVAGMGGETIASILEAAPWTKSGKRPLLQPMTSFPELRGWLGAHGYRIEREYLAREGKRLYSVMEVFGGSMAPLTPSELWAGRQSDDPLRGAWLEYISSKVSRALEGHLAAKERDQAELMRLREVLSGLEEMREEL